MKRFDEMDERELMEVRAKMTPEEIARVVQEEEEEMARMVKAAQIMEPSVAQEEQEESIVNFNPETNEAVEIESTVVARESEEPRSKKRHKSMITITDMQEDFGYFDGLLITKALKQMVTRRQEQENELRMMSGKHHPNVRLTSCYEKLAEETWEEIRMLRSVIHVRERRYDVLGNTSPSFEDRKTNRTPVQQSLRERIQDLPKPLINELSEITYTLGEELLDIL